MSEQKINYMAELDAWTDEAIIDRLMLDDEEETQPVSDEDIAHIKSAIREKVLESYKNGCKVGAGHVRKEMSHVQAQTR